MPVDRRKHSHLVSERFQEQGVHTATSVEQRNIEELCLRLYEKAERRSDEVEDLPVLNRTKTIAFLRKGLKSLSEGYQSLDASRPWLLYWILHSLELLGERVSCQEEETIVKFLARCQDPAGGFGGGPGQLAHLAPTYAAVNALVIVGSESALSLIDRQKLYSWLDKLRCDDGAFTMHVDGEVDIRGVYCALSVARLTNIYTSSLFKNTEQWLLRCQTYEGGFGGVPGMEAHGGYSFCGLAALCLMGKERLCNTDSLLLWTANRQMRLEGGFQGRTNKLVDGCYSFWQGGVFPLIHKILAESSDSAWAPANSWLFNRSALQEYLLICCQDHRGGLIDKPGKSADYYHTCYTLSGLSVAQHFTFNQTRSTLVIGDTRNLLEPTHPLYNVGITAALRAAEYYGGLASPGE